MPSPTLPLSELSTIAVVQMAALRVSARHDCHADTAWSIHARRLVYRQVKIFTLAISMHAFYLALNKNLHTLCIHV